MVKKELNGRPYMKIRPRMKKIALYSSVALAQLSAGPASADSGVGVDTVLGNALNPYTFSSINRKDPEGIGEGPNSHSPTGFLNEEPNIIKEPNKTESGWLYNATGEIGVLGGDATLKNVTFRKYKDLNNGLYLNNFGLQMEKPDQARYFEAQGGAVGRDDQFYGAQFGRYNDWKVKLFYNETSHVFTDSFKSFWGGVGSGSLTLPSNVPAAGGATCTNPPTCTTFSSAGYGLAAGSTQAQVNNAVATRLNSAVPNADNTELSIVRKKGGVRYDVNLPADWKFFASYSDEKREGSRPFGATWGGGGGSGNIEIVEPINYNTHEFLAGVQFADKLSAFNATVSASLFRNNIDTLTFQNLFLPATANGINGAAFTTGRIDLYPNNNFYNAKAEYARSMPEFYSGRFTGVLSLSSSRQDASLIPSTTQSGTAVAPATAAGGWDTGASLSKSSAGAKIDTRLADLGLSLNPASNLDVKGKLRYYETENSTDYWACNPLTGQLGRLINDGTGGAFASFVNTNGSALSAAQITSLNTFMTANGCNVAALKNYLVANGLVPAAGNINLRNVPYEYKQLVYGLSADYRLNRNNGFNAAWEREDYKRKYRERDETWEDKFKFGYVNRSLEGGTLRMSFENDRRRGDQYNSDPYEAFYSVSLGNILTAAGTNMTSWVHNIEQFRKYDLADRDQNVLNGRFNYMLRPDLDGGVSLQLKDIKYPDSQYGRNDHQLQNSVNFDLNWRPSNELSFYGYYSYQDARTKQANVQPNACAIGTTYSFWSNGVVNTGAAVPGATLLGTTAVTAANWEAVCAMAGPFSPLYPSSRGWNVTQTDRNDVLGLGLKYDFGKAKLSLDYSYVFGRTGIRYDYNGTALGMTAAQMAAAGSGFPDMNFTQHIIDANLLIPVEKKISLRLLWHYEWGKISDWHYDGVASNPTAGAGTGLATQNLYLDTGPQKYKASVIGAFLRFDL